MMTGLDLELSHEKVDRMRALVGALADLASTIPGQDERLQRLIALSELIEEQCIGFQQTIAVLLDASPASISP